MRRFKKAAAIPFALLLAFSVFMSASPLAEGLPHPKEIPQQIDAEGMGAMIIEDLNSDGLDDLAVCGYAMGMVFVYFHREIAGGEPLPPFPDERIFTPFPSRIAAGDVTSDGKSDLVILGENQIRIYQQTPPNSFEFLIQLDLSDARDIAIGDSGPDGLNDIFVTGRLGTTVFFQEPIPTRFHPLHNHFIPDAAGDSLTLTRINDDDFLDLVVASQSQIVTFMHIATNEYGINSTLELDTMDYNPEYLLVGDVNSDNLVDIVISRPRYDDDKNGMVKIFLSDPSHGYSPSDAIEVLADVSTLTLVDFEDDGTSEILLSLMDGNLYVMSQSSGFALPASPLITLSEPVCEPGSVRLLASNDFNLDSRRDIAVRVPGFVLLFLMEDSPVELTMPIPSNFHLNEGETRHNLIDLRQYFSDDYGILDFRLIFEEDDSKLDAILSGHFLDFRAASGWSGSLTFQVEASDLNPMNRPAKSNVFSVWVNDAPRIVSTPPTTADIGSEYSYQIIVDDDYPEWDTTRFKLTSGSEGMKIDENGLLTWTPRDSGIKRVQIEVRDVFGLSDVQTFEIDVPPLPPPPPALPPETPYVTGTAAVALTAVAVAALISENIKWALLLLFLPLYSKIRRERVLDHFIRGQIYGYILANPGEHYNAIKQALNLTNGSLAHHLKTLEREEFVKSRKYGLYRRFYPKHMRIPDDGGFRMNPIQKHIMGLIGQNPGISQKEIARAINITPPTVNYHIGILASAKLIHVVRNGRKTQCFVDRS